MPDGAHSGSTRSEGKLVRSRPTGHVRPGRGPSPSRQAASLGTQLPESRGRAPKDHGAGGLPPPSIVASGREASRNGRAAQRQTTETHPRDDLYLRALGLCLFFNGKEMYRFGRSDLLRRRYRSSISLRLCSAPGGGSVPPCFRDACQRLVRNPDGSAQARPSKNFAPGHLPVARPDDPHNALSKGCLRTRLLFRRRKRHPRHPHLPSTAGLEPQSRVLSACMERRMASVCGRGPLSDLAIKPFRSRTVPCAGQTHAEPESKPFCHGIDGFKFFFFFLARRF